MLEQYDNASSINLNDTNDVTLFLIIIKILIICILLITKSYNVKK